MSNLSDVTALVCTFLRDEYLFNCVRSLKNTYPSIRVLVADDGHISDVKEHGLRALGVEKYIRMPFNVGICAKRNTLLTYVETPYILIGDDDFTYTVSTRLQDLHQMMDICDLAGGAMLEEGVNLKHFESVFLQQSDGGLLFKDIVEDYVRSSAGIRYAFADLVFNFFIAKTTTIRGVGWEENIKVCYEHEDFFLGLHQQSVKVAYCPDSVVQHRTLLIPDSKEYYEYRLNIADKDAFFAKWGFAYVQDQQGRRLLPHTRSIGFEVDEQHHNTSVVGWHFFHYGAVVRQIVHGEWARVPPVHVCSRDWGSL